MKNIKKIGAMILVVAMLCAMSITAFAAGETVDAVVENSANDSEISINNAKVEKSGSTLTVTLSYSISGNVAEGDQITMLGYIFETGENASEIDVVTGDIRAINQDAAKASGGEIVFKLATAGEGYTVAADAKMVVKLGSNAADVTKAQAFFIDLSKVSETGILGDVDGNEKIEAKDAMAIRQFLFYNTEMPRADLADVDGNEKIEAKDAMAIRQFLFYNTPFPGAQ